MGGEEGGRRRSRSGEDLISGLPDEVLHCVLVRLRSARAAARTGVLSRRWRRVWAHLPELHLDGGLEALPPAVASFPDAVDGALAGCLAPALERLSIAASADGGGLGIPAAGRAAPWLRFAAGRVAGELRLVVPWRLESPLPEGSEIELPLCQGAKTIELCLRYDWWLRLPPPAAGLFTSLTALKIHGCGLDGSELTTLVCTQCPHLSALSLNVTLLAAADVSIRSDSLHSLSFWVMNILRLEVVAPRLEELTLACPLQAHISAPKLAKLGWCVGDYDPRNQRFVDVGRRLLLLEISKLCRVASLLQQIDEVDILKLDFFILGLMRYRKYLDDTKILPKCKTLIVSISWGHHCLPPLIPHLLRSCNSTTKFSLTFSHCDESTMSPCWLSCPCRLEENHRFDAIDLGSLEEVEISSSEFSHHELEFVELLSRCNATFLKKLVINYNVIGTPETKELCEKVYSMCPPNVELELYLFPDGPDGRRVRFN